MKFNTHFTRTDVSSQNLSKNVVSLIPYFFKTRCSQGCSTITFVTHSLNQSVSDPFPPNLQNIITPKRKSWGAEVQTEWSPPTTCYVSGVRCQTSGLFFLFFLKKKWWIQLVERMLSTGTTLSSPNTYILKFINRAYPIQF